MIYHKILMHLCKIKIDCKQNSFKNNIKNIGQKVYFHSTTLRSNAPIFTKLFTTEHDELRKTVNKIIDKDINPFVDLWEEEGQFPAKELFKKLGNAGLLGITQPNKYGGLGLDYSFSFAFLEELSNINCAGIPLAIKVQTDMSTPALSRFGSEELKQEFLAPSITGDRVSCIGISEVQSGSDVASISTKAVRKGDDLIINGGKMWITNGCQADWMCMLANTREGPPHKNKSLICVPLNLPGIKFTKIRKLGNCSSDTAQFFFEDVKVPSKNIIGEEGMGFIYQMLQFQNERLAGVSSVASTLTKIVNDTIRYCKERHAFGQPLINNQIIYYTLAELQTEIESLRALVYRAAACMIDDQDVTMLASMAKLKAGRLSREVTDKCLQFYGGMGYTSDIPISRQFRDLRLVSVGGGADEVMLSVISKYMKILPIPQKKK